MLKYLLILSILVSCKPTSTKVVKTAIEQYLTPVSVSITDNGNIGEIEYGADPVDVTIQIKNNSEDSLQSLALNIPTDQGLIKFKPTATGARNSPGSGGTCGSALAVDETCTYVLSIATSKRGTFSTNINFSYKNLVKEQSSTININGLIGIDALLAYSTGTNAFDLSIIEQTDSTEKLASVTIKNTGELSARNINSVFNNTSGNGTAYRIYNDGCGSTIKGGNSCTMIIGYKPLNTNTTDAAETYKGTLNLTYVKNPSDLTAQLNSTFTFLSTKIQANFKNYDTTLAPINFTSTAGAVYTTVGTKQSKSFAIINSGYRSGIIDSLTISGLAAGDAICVKGTGTILDCSINSVATTLVTFPFVVEDVDSCLTKTIATTDPKCNFNITFWPSSTLSTGSTINLLTIITNARNFWKNDNITQTNNSIVDISSITYSGAGNLVLYSVDVTPPGLAKINTYSWPGTNSTIGTIKMLGSSNPNLASTYYNIVLSYKNIGESPVLVSNIVDAAATAHSIPFSGGGTSFGYYSNVVSSCGSKVLPNGLCTISYRLTPVGSPDTHDLNLFDYFDPLDIAASYKSFKLTYSNGISYLDTGAAATSPMLASQIEANPIAQGYLVIETGTLSFTATAGDSTVKTITIRNVGTGNAKLTTANNQTYNPLNPADTNYRDWTFQFIDGGNGDECGIYGVSAADVVLTPNQTCKISVRISVPDIWRSYTDTFTNTQLTELNRSFENQNELNATNRSIVNMGLNYLSEELNSSSNTLTNTISLYSTFITAANIVPTKPYPLQSAVLYRPSINYSAISTTYPQSITLPAKVIPETFFDTNMYPYRYIAAVKTPAAACPASKTSTTYQNCWDNFYRAHLSVDHLNGLAITKNSGEYILHAGTFPTNQVTNFKYSLLNTGSIYAGNLNFVQDASTDPIVLSVNTAITSLSNGASLLVSVKFTPTVAGVFSRCGTLNYNSVYNGYNLARSTRVCVYAEAVDTGVVPTSNSMVSIESSDDGVTYTNLTSPLNGIDNSKMANFYVITGSGTTSYTKRFRFTNNSTNNLTQFSYYVLAPGGVSTASNLPASVASPSGALPSTYLSMKDSSNGSTVGTPCSEAMTLLPGNSCEIEITYSPSATDSKKIYYIGTIFEIASKQYVSYTGSFSAEAAQATKLQLVNITFPTPITPSAVGVYDTSRVYYNSSYPVSLNSDPSNPYASPMKITSSEISPVYTVRVSNPSTKLKASFLPHWTNLNPATPFPSTEYIQLISNDDIYIEAGRPCFFGDDEGSSLTQSQMGFYSTSSNKCYLKITFKGYKSYQLNSSTCSKVAMGGLISSDCNPYVYNLTYWSTDGNTSVDSTMTMHMQGYMQPNGVSSSSSYLQAISSSSTGMVKIAAPELTPNASDKGSIVTNIICYDKDYTKFYGTNIYKLIEDYSYSGSTLSNIGSTAGIENCLAFSASDEIINIPGLTKSNLYFFKVLAIRTLTDVSATVNYISDSSAQILTVPIPEDTQFYDPNKLVLIDKNYNGIGNRDQAMDTCESTYNTLYKTSIAVKVKKQLITSSIFSSILNTSNSNGSSYSGFDVGLVSHWLGDDAYDIGSSISLYDGTITGGFTGYTLGSKVGSEYEKRAIYSKSCTDKAECSLLYKIVGGDPSDGLYQNGVFYTTADGASAVIRCFNYIPCPTDTKYLINSASCVQP